MDVMASLGVDISRRNELPDTLGLRIDMVVDPSVRPATVEWAKPSGSSRTGYCPCHFTG